MTSHGNSGLGDALNQSVLDVVDRMIRLNDIGDGARGEDCEDE